MPRFLSLGVSENRFLDGDPEDLKPFIAAEKIRQKRIDAEMWQQGWYMMHAVGVAVSHCLNGRSSQAEYLDEPLTMAAEKRKKEEAMTDADHFRNWATAFNAQNHNKDTNNTDDNGGREDS